MSEKVIGLKKSPPRAIGGDFSTIETEKLNSPPSEGWREATGWSPPAGIMP